MGYLSSEKLSSSRAENSLHSLTKKFFEYLKMTYPRPINTNSLASFLCVSKRRVYDVTNILEGLGYLKKRSVNSLEWTGGDFNQFLSDKENDPFSQNNIYSDQTVENQDLNMLEIEESALDREINELNINVQSMLQQESSITNAFVNHDDLLNIPTLSNKLVFVVKAPPETFLENKDTNKEFAIEMNVNNDKIDVFYISDEK